jgi:hypothetical protein
VLQDADVEAEVAYITARQSTARTSAAGTVDNNDAAGPSSSSGEWSRLQYACRAVCLLASMHALQSLQKTRKSSKLQAYYNANAVCLLAGMLALQYACSLLRLGVSRQ